MNHGRLWAGSCSVFPAAGTDVEKTGNSLLSDSVFSYGKFDLLSCFGRYQQVFSGSRVAGTVVSALVLPAVFLGVRSLCCKNAAEEICGKIFI